VAASLYSLGLSQGRDVGISGSSNGGCPPNLSHFQSGLLYSLRGFILVLPCPMTMSVYCRTHCPGSRSIYLISSFIPRDSRMGSTSLGGEIYPPTIQGPTLYSRSVRRQCFSHPLPYASINIGLGSQLIIEIRLSLQLFLRNFPRKNLRESCQWR
jgi:hypothetical protein